jgi:hypothetical protein
MFSMQIALSPAAIILCRTAAWSWLEMDKLFYLQTMYLEQVGDCSADVSIAYYTTKSTPKKVCYKCGENKEIKGQPKNEDFLYYRPVCKTCQGKGEKPNSRKQRKDKGMNRPLLDTTPQVNLP